MQVYSDSAIQAKGTILFFHGSGGRGDLSVLFPALVAQGYRILSLMNLNSGDSDTSLFRHGYYATFEPQFMSRFIKDAYYVKIAVEQVPLGTPFLLLGHSQGASGILGYLAGLAGPPRSFGYRGSLCNGATIGGLGDFSWNDVMRNLNQLGGVLSQLRLPAHLVYGNQDAYAPPDYAKRLQLYMPQHSTMLSAGNRGHNWLDTSDGTALVTGWIDQIWDGVPVTTLQGVPATPGPVQP